MNKSPYLVLGVPRDATEEQIKNAHRALAKAHHPDVNGGGGAQERMAAINVARDQLLDPEKRAAVNRELDERLFEELSRVAAAAAAPAHAQQPPPVPAHAPPESAFDWGTLFAVAAVAAGAVAVGAVVYAAAREDEYYD